MKRKVKVDLEELSFALENNFSELRQYLDLETGSIVTIADEDAWKLEEIYEEIYDEDGNLLITLEDYLQQEGGHDWQKEMILEADRVEQGYGTRYIRVEHDSRDDYRTMERFVGTVEDDDLREHMWDAIQGRGAFRYFKDLLYRHPELREEWFAFKNARLQQRVAGWLETYDIEPV